MVTSGGPIAERAAAHPIAKLLPENAAASLKRWSAPRGATAFAAGGAITHVVFVTEGLGARLAVTKDGRAETGLARPGGMIGESAALGASRWSHDILALSDMAGVSLDTGAFMAARAASSDFATALDMALLERLSEAERLCACAALHAVDRRLARWLVDAGQALGSETVAITHGELSLALGVRRASVTTSLHLIEGEAAVRCRRGVIEIRDGARLAQLSCGCERKA